MDSNIIKIKPILFFLGLCNAYGTLPEIGLTACYKPDHNMICEMSYLFRYHKALIPDEITPELEGLILLF